MSTVPQCPKCNSANVYEYDGLYTCPDCSHEWSTTARDFSPADDSDVFIVKDAYGNVLTDGDTVQLIKDLNVKGAKNQVKSGTKVKNIRLVDGDHNIDCNVPGFGAMGLKSEFVKKIPV